MVSFLGIGAPRCATTWIARCLSEHPDIFIPEQKETYFFSRPALRAKGLHWYHSQFSNRKPGQVVGEFTTDYYLNPKIARWSQIVNPKMKYLMVCRDPAQRAWSHYQYLLARGKNMPSFEKCVGTLHPIIQMGFYHQYLKEFIAECDRAQLHVVIYDDLIADPVATIQSVYRFLEVDSNFVPPSVSIHVNSGSINLRYPWLQGLYMRRIELRGQWWYPKLRSVLVGLGFRRLFLILTVQSNVTEKSMLSTSMREQLVDLYRPDVVGLEKFLHTDLPRWKFL